MKGIISVTYKKEYLTLLALKYRPWQFKWCSQESGSVDVSWVEIDEWLYKYKEI